MTNLQPLGKSTIRRGVALMALIALAASPGLACADDHAVARRTGFGTKQMIESGGAVGIVIIAMSVFMLALVIEHLFSLRRSEIAPQKLVNRLQRLIQQRQFDRAAAACRQSRSLLAAVVGPGLARVEEGYPVVEKAMEDACAESSARLYRKIDYLSVIGTLSPMLGLLGTVWGMMIAFSEFAAKANVQVTELAPGIATALVTTLLGLAVAIPAYAAFAFFRSRVDEAVASCAQIAESLFLNGHRMPSVTVEREKTA